MRIIRAWQGWKEMPRVAKNGGWSPSRAPTKLASSVVIFFPLCYHRNMSCAICRSPLEQVLASAGSGQGLVRKNVSPEIERKRNWESMVCYPDVRKCLNNTHIRSHPPARTHLGSQFMTPSVHEQKDGVALLKMLSTCTGKIDKFPCKFTQWNTFKWCV